MDTLPPLAACVSDTLRTELDIPQGGMWEIQALLIGSANQDTLTQTLRLIGTPAPLPLDESICLGDTVTLSALSTNPSLLKWYQTSLENTPFHVGDSLTIPGLLANTTFWVSATGMPEIWNDRLQTVDQHDRDWNGIMIDLVPQVDLVLDTVFLPINTTGNQRLKLYMTQGSYRGKEQTSQDWQLHDSIDASVSSISSWIPFPLDSVALSAGDTVGLYLHLANPSGRLRYQAVSSPQTFSNDELSLITGTGISHTFGQTYFPRMINAAFSYHYSIGPCESARIPLQVELTDPRFQLGPDTTVSMGDTLVLTGPIADDYEWSTGDSTQTIQVFSPSGQTDTLKIWLDTRVGPSCAASDTLIVRFTPTLSIPHTADAGKNLIHYEAENQVFWLTKVEGSIADIYLMDIMGRHVAHWPGPYTEGRIYPIPTSPKGIYWICLRHTSLDQL
ncbi:MAG: hypothetical protein AAFR59_14720, partial [Bacteroidota bacterium]